MRISALLFLAACTPEDSADTAIVTDEPVYVVGSALFGPEGTSTYLAVLRDLGPQEIDYAQAIELPGWADVWVHEGAVYVSEGETPQITRYTVTDAGQLEAGATVSFANYGITDAAFWNNTFVSTDKAYMKNGASEYVIWNPQTMEITGTLPLPAFEPRDGLELRPGTTDRSNVIRDGALYQPFYGSDADYVRFSEDSAIVVIDIATDTVVDTIEAACAGLDIGTQDEAGNLWFSPWTSGVITPIRDGAAPTCVTKIPVGSELAETAFAFADLTDGREGAAVHDIVGDKLVFSTFHDERVEITADSDPWALVGGANWRLWTYDPATNTASENATIDWNSGAVYTFDVGGGTYALVPATDYATSSVYALDDDGNAEHRFDTDGWSIRLFQVR